MDYKVVGDVMQALQMDLRQGEEVFAEAGAMLYMDNGVELQAKMQGGFVKGLMRKFLAGESMFMSVFRCNGAKGRLALANPVAGKIIPIELNGNTVLAERKGRVQSREALLRDVWEYDNFIDTRTVDTHMRRLRDKLGDAARYLDTVRGVGYRFVDQK